MPDEILPEEENQKQENSHVPATVDELAKLTGQQGVQIINRRIEILQAARAGSIRLTHPRDWVLFKADSGVYAYLQDSGCERLMDIWGIEVTNVTPINQEDLSDGSYILTLFGDGLCKLTGQRVERILGARDSTSMEMGNDIHPGKLKIETMKAARSNLDGGIVRHLAGLANVPIEEINRILGRKKDDDSQFNLGRGFGSQRQRHGDIVNEYGEPPACPKCKKPMRFFAGKDGREPFWGCQDYKTCGQKPITAKKKMRVRDAVPKEDIERAKALAAEMDREPGDETEEIGDLKESTIGAFKTRLLADIQALAKAKKITPAWETQAKGDVIRAETIDQLRDLEIGLKENQ